MYSEEKAAKYGMDLTDDKKEIKKEKVSTYTQLAFQ